MIVCRTCGRENAQADSFCGSCGGFLEWSADEALTTSPHSPAEVRRAGAESPERARARAPGPPAIPGAVACSACGVPNAPTRTFCQACGAVLNPLRPGRTRRDGLRQPPSIDRRHRPSGRGRTVALVCLGLVVGAGIIVLPLVLASGLPSPGGEAGSSPYGASSPVQSGPSPSASVKDGETSPSP